MELLDFHEFRDSLMEFYDFRNCNSNYIIFMIGMIFVWNCMIFMIFMIHDSKIFHGFCNSLVDLNDFHDFRDSQMEF